MNRITKATKTGAWAAACFLLLILPAAAAETPPSASAALCKSGFSSKSEKVASGIELISASCEAPLFKAFITKISLTSAGYEIITTPPKLFFSEVEQFGKKTGSLVATNGGFYGKGHGGWFMSYGKEMGKFIDNEYTSVLGVGKNKNGKIKAEIFPPEHIMPKGGGAPDWIFHGLTGIPLMLHDGKIISTLPSDNFIKPPEKPGPSMWEERHPRTGVGFSKDGSQMLLVVVDGRQKSWSKGLRIKEFAQLFKQFGTWNALNLDGGCSSAMYVNNGKGLVSSPCQPKGKVRLVATHFAVVPLKKVKTVSKIFMLPGRLLQTLL